MILFTVGKGQLPCWAWMGFSTCWFESGVQPDFSSADFGSELALLNNTPLTV